MVTSDPARRKLRAIMAKLSRLEKLFSAVAAHDWARARTVALAIVEDEEAHQHVPAALRLRAALRQVNSTARMLPMNGQDFRSEDALTPVASTIPLDEVILGKTSRRQLQILKEEWRNRDLLLHAGVRRRSRLLFHGPPGCGKSLSAVALGFETNLPVHVVRLDAIVGSYLGETATRVHAVLRWASEFPSVLVLDEIDAIARRRGKHSDVAELDRVVVALLQELEHTSPAGFLVATTNRLDDLDDALFRRFDLLMELPRPTATALMRFSEREAARFGLQITADVKRSVRATRSFAEARRLIEDLRRETILGVDSGSRT